MVENIAVPRLTIVSSYQVQTAVAKHDSKTSLSFSLRMRVDWHSLGLLIAGIIALAQGRSTPHTSTPSTTYNAVKTVLTVHLADSSTVILNKGSQLKVRLTAGARDIELPQGEAVFRVSPDPARPFRVAAGTHVSVQAIGTAFLVSQSDPDHTEVLVTQGRVAVSSEAGVPTEVDAGAGLQIQHGTPSSLDLAADGLDARLEWANPLAVHKIRDLADIVRTLNEFNDTQLVIADSRIASLRIDGSILSLTEPEAFADSLRDLFNIRARTDRDKTGRTVIRLYGKERAPKHR